MSYQKTQTIRLRIEPNFTDKPNYLADIYAAGNRSELIRENLERLYFDTKAEEVAMAIATVGHKPR
ncbi:MAG: hypothetical protein KME05_15455 [Gloeocapsa sp. UFS-A4-WI-NPMV-4B04]|jgi:hypothetical protein|nr:hypothetical protein [Gloeocapsa sp. UFS-A4-WI-NPMV-4B04]